MRKYDYKDNKYISGQSIGLILNLYNSDNTPFDASSYTGTFSLREYENKDGAPKINKEVKFLLGETGLFSRVEIRLTPRETIMLDGKFISQLTLKSADDTEIPEQMPFVFFFNFDKRATICI